MLLLRLPLQVVLVKAALQEVELLEGLVGGSFDFFFEGYSFGDALKVAAVSEQHQSHVGRCL